GGELLLLLALLDRRRGGRRLRDAPRGGGRRRRGESGEQILFDTDLHLRAGPARGPGGGRRFRLGSRRRRRRTAGYGGDRQDLVAAGAAHPLAAERVFGVQFLAASAAEGNRHGKPTPLSIPRFTLSMSARVRRIVEANSCPGSHPCAI